MATRVEGATKLTSLKEELGRGADTSIIKVVALLLTHAHESGASDIHIEPTPHHVRVRMRVDGVLQEVTLIQKTIHNEIISRIKVLSGLRTDEHQAAQDGRFHEKISVEDVVDIRVSIAPTYHGENAVLRLLADRDQHSTLAGLGFSASDCQKIEKALTASTGMILATGPTGSGKTTTLYTLIKMLNAPEVAIITIEDPVEYSIDDIEQIPVNARTGLTFANGLRSILRQDPDILMVGEIRDAETARIAINTALTGHLLLSTLHTNDAATTLPRLLDMGIDSYLVASTITLAIGQRLVRTLCKECQEFLPLSAEDAESLSNLEALRPLVAGERIGHRRGCIACNVSGYRGRMSLNEVLVADGDIREAIIRRASAHELKQIAIQNGMTTMLDDGIEKVREGRTTIEEVLRVIHD